jgi:glyoxalase family protein
VNGYEATSGAGSLIFADWEGLGLELVVADGCSPPLRALHLDIPAEHAIVGLHGARAFAPAAEVGEPLLTETLGFDHLGSGEYELAGSQRRFNWSYDLPTAYGQPGAGTVHHIPWATEGADQVEWQRRIMDAGIGVSAVQDRDYFRSISFREPQGILFEIATLSPGFAVDEDATHLGEQLRLPRIYRGDHARLEQALSPVVNPRARRRIEV